MSIVRANKLSKSYGTGEVEVQALRDIALTIKRGEFVAIMGASGSGKSTLLQLLGCLDEAGSGELVIGDDRINGQSDKELSLLRRRKIGFVFQSYNLIQVLTVEENVALPLLIDRRLGSGERQWLEELLGLVNLTHRRHHFPNQLSGGEQQRTAIARALVTRPAIVLADEPTGNLDSITSEYIMKLLRRSCDDFEQTIVLVTHDPKDAAYADRIIFLKDGTIVDESEITGRAHTETIVDSLREVND